MESIRAHLRSQFQRRLHPEIAQNGQVLIVKIKASRLRLSQQQITEAQRQHDCCKFEDKHLVMEGKHEHLCKCIDFLAKSEVAPSDDARVHARAGRRNMPRSAVR